jgi:hypothetical protein
MAASDYVPIFFKYRLHLARRPQMSTRPSLDSRSATHRRGAIRWQVAVAVYSIAGATRQDGASLRKSCFAEAVDIDLR